MPGLAPPPPRNQVGTADRDRFELCGESCVASALDLDVESVVVWLRQHAGGERAVQTGTSPEELIAVCRAHGIPAQIVRGPATTYVSTAVRRGHYAVVLVWSDHQGHPTSRTQSARLHHGGIGHWLLGYGTSGQAVQVMQPWGGKLVTYDLRQGQDQQLGVEIYKVIGHSTTRPPKAPGPPRPAPSVKQAAPTKPAAASKRPAPIKPTPARPPAAHQYVVVKGDTLSRIARKQGVSLAALLAANPQIKDKNKIFPGQSIRIP